MSYPITVDEKDLEVFRIARLLGKQKVLELLKVVHSKGIDVDYLLGVVKGEVRTEEKELNKEAVSFILGWMVDKFPEVEIPPRIKILIPSIKVGGKISKAKREARRAKSGEIAPRTAYMVPILETLVEMGGSGRMSDILDSVFKKMKDTLMPKDFGKLPSGTGIRWKNRAQWERQRLINEGYLKRDSPRGIWEITDAGRKFYESWKERR